MTLKTLYSIILKVVGILLLEKIITSAVQVVAYMIAYGLFADFMVWLISFVTLLVYCIFFYFLVFRSEYIIYKLKLVSETEEDDFSFSLKEGDNVLQSLDAGFIIRLALLITGIYILIHEVPNFIQQLASYYQQKRDYMQSADSTFSYIALSGAKILIAYIILQVHETIAAYVIKKAGKGQ